MRMALYKMREHRFPFNLDKNRGKLVLLGSPLPMCLTFFDCKDFSTQTKISISGWQEGGLGSPFRNCGKEKSFIAFEAQESIKMASDLVQRPTTV